MADTISKLRFLKRENISNQQVLQANYYRELIQIYGMDIEYYRRDLDYYQKEVNTDTENLPFETYSSTTADRIYGEQPSSHYMAPVEMVSYVSVVQETIAFSAFNIAADTAAELYITKRDFSESMRDTVGKPMKHTFSRKMDLKASYDRDYNIIFTIEGECHEAELDCTYSESFSIPKDTTTIDIDIPFERIPVSSNPLLKSTFKYVDQKFLGGVTGTLSVNVSPYTGDVYIKGILSGDLGYRLMSTPESGAPNSPIAPQVGDYIKLVDFDRESGNLEEYEITNILDRDLSPTGINPVVGKYIWRCSIARRMSSHEDVEHIDGILATECELFTPDQIKHNVFIEEESDKIFDYDTSGIDTHDKKGSDKVYGGYDSGLGMGEY